MAYVRSRHLTFKFGDVDPALEGLEIRTKRISSGTVVELMELRGRRAQVQDGEVAADDAREVLERPFELLADVIVSWNLEEEDDDGNTVPVEPTREALLADIPWSTKLLRAWMGSIMSISQDLGKESPSGETSPEPSIPMEPLSESLQNSSAPS